MNKLKRKKNKNKNKNSWFTIYFLGGIVGVPMSVMCQFWIAFLEMDFRRYKDFSVNRRKLDVHFWKMQHSTNGVSINFFFFFFFLFLFWSRRWAMLLFSITAGSLLFFFFFLKVIKFMSDLTGIVRAWSRLDDGFSHPNTHTHTQLLLQV
jgi:MFS family permease